VQLIVEDWGQDVQRGHRSRGDQEQVAANGARAASAPAKTKRRQPASGKRPSCCFAVRGLPRGLRDAGRPFCSVVHSTRSAFGVQVQAGGGGGGVRGGGSA
jgi:hypothetical protein